MEVLEKIKTAVKMPFCPGCGHGVCVRSITTALEHLDYSPNDVVIVSDIGCSGLVDPIFATHTVHGLHGRSTALGLGISLGLDNPNKKVIVLLGDGGATIGLQHILEGARRNVDMTVVVMNNLLYGMTGGQMSGLSSPEFKHLKNSEDATAPYDLVRLAHEAGAGLSVRVTAISNFTTTLEDAIGARGFSFVELSSLCTSHGMKKIAEMKAYIPNEEKLFNHRPIGRSLERNSISLMEGFKPPTKVYKTAIAGQLGVVIAGSAGGAVQSAAKLLARAGMISGLYSSMKGEYPITVGTGFSIAEVILSKSEINYTGLESPDIIIVVSDDGWQKVKHRIGSNTLVFADSNIKIDMEYFQKCFVKAAGKKGAALCAISYWLRESNVLDTKAIEDLVIGHKIEQALLKAISVSKNI